MDQQSAAVELIEEILNDPDAQVEDARLLLGRRRNVLCGIEHNVVDRMSTYASIFDIARNIAVLRDMTDLLTAVRDFATLDIGRRCPSVSVGREEKAKLVVDCCEMAIASLQHLMQHEHLDRGIK